MKSTTVHSTRRSRFLARVAGEEGFATEIVILPGLFLLLVAALQGALWYMAGTVAQTAAVAAYTNARAYPSTADPLMDTSTADSAHTAVEQIITGMHGFLIDPTVDITRSPTTVTVTISGHPESLLPGVVLPPVTRTITGPVERWVPAP
jgi:hypothetical protein